MHIGFIGLGRMGKPMATNLCRHGYAITVHDINSAPVRELERAGAQSTTDLHQMASTSDVILTMLPDSKAVESVILGSGLLANARPGLTIMDMSTVSPETTDRLAAECQRQSVGFVDAPVGRLASHAERGECLFMVGASDQDFKRVEPLLQAMGTTIHHCGAAGAGTRTKLVNNYLAIVSCQLNSEALALSQRFGLDLERTLDVLYGTTAVNGQLKIAWPNKVLAGDIEPGFTVDLAHKDLTLIVEAANQGRVPMPVGAAAREAFSVARSRGYGAKDFSSVVDALCEVADISKPRLKPR